MKQICLKHNIGYYEKFIYPPPIEEASKRGCCLSKVGVGRTGLLVSHCHQALELGRGVSRDIIKQRKWVCEASGAVLPPEEDPRRAKSKAGA